jgi:hypothetical protein
MDPGEVVPAAGGPVVRADGDRRDRLPVARVDQLGVRRRVHRVLLAPLAQREHRGQQVAALLGHAVLDLAAIVLARGAREHAVIDQPRQAVREDVAGDAELARELLEMHQPVERGAQDHERPALAHHLERRRQPAFGRGLQVFAQFAHPKACIRKWSRISIAN